MAFSERTIKAVFTNLLFVIGVILTVFGFVRGTSTVVKLVVFDKYPLFSYEETRCKIDLRIYPGPDAAPIDPTDEEKRVCEESIEKERKLRVVEDVTASVSFFVAGLALSFAFRRFIFRQ